MSESTLVPHNCKACGYWTATEIIRTRVGWTLRCTHCGNNAYERGGERSFRLFLVAIARFQQNVSTRYPELARLTVRGAHAVYPARVPQAEGPRHG